MTYEEENKLKKRWKDTHELTKLLENQVQSDISLLSEYISLMNDKKLLNQITCLNLTIEEIRMLDTLLDDSKKLELKKSKIYLYLNSPTELMFNEYEKLVKLFNIYAVVVNGLVKPKYNVILETGKGDSPTKIITKLDNSAKVIDSRLWYEYLKNLTRLTNGIRDLCDVKGNDKEKIMFCILCKRISESVTYDLDAENSFFERAGHEYHFNNVTNEIVGLIDGRCVCRGYAGIVRDGCAVLGIDSIVIYGGNGNFCHAWNQVKLDEKWYNVDMDLEASRILKNKDTRFFLTSNEDFYRAGELICGGIGFHSSFILGRIAEGKTSEKVCMDSVPKEKIKVYLNLEENKKKKWLEKNAQNIKDQTEGSMKK